MKTRQYISGLLILLIFGVPSMQAQSARRAAPQQRNERAATTRTTTKQSDAQKVQKQQEQPQRAQQPARQVQQQPEQRQRAQQPARQVQQQPEQRQRAQQPARQVQQQPEQRQRAQQPARQVQQQRTPASISTPDNPRSTYRQPVSSTAATREVRSLPNRVTQYSTRNYYGGNIYHYVYPTRTVNIHIHHDTYLHDYHVLYYPAYHNIFWTRSMYRDYIRWYPGYTWRYNYGYRINAISIFEARYNLGEVAMVYGRVYATWYNAETDDYLLFFGGDYPNHQFTIVLPGNIARRFSWRPERYFLGEHVTVTGLITTFDGIPEIIVRNRRQLERY